jgi:fucose 4-O-acetylase-like acetyltransferase
VTASVADAAAVETASGAATCHTSTIRETRLVFLDQLRVALTILVVLHHLAVIYGANASFYYVEPPYNDALAFIALTALVLIDQAFFMGLFFLISGYVTPAAYDRKGTGHFLRDRLLRLGIPLGIFVLVLNPIASIGIYQMPAEWTGVTTPFTWQQYPSLLGVGPLWFVEMLLLFDLGYAVWRELTARWRPAWKPRMRAPGAPAVAGFAVALAAVTFVWRIAVPIGLTVPIAGFPTLAYLPQYVGFFLIGVAASRYEWIASLHGRAGKIAIATAVVTTVVLFPLALSGATAFVGGGQWQSAVYALWDSIFAVSFSVALLVAFHAFLNRQSVVGRFLARHAYAVYVVHVPVIVLLALGLRSVELESLLKFGLAAVVGVPLCFAVAYIVRGLPLVRSVL